MQQREDDALGVGQQRGEHVFGRDVLVVARERLLACAASRACRDSHREPLWIHRRSSSGRRRVVVGAGARVHRVVDRFGVRGRGAGARAARPRSGSRRARRPGASPALSTAVETCTRCAPSSSNRYRVTVATASVPIPLPRSACVVDPGCRARRRPAGAAAARSPRAWSSPTSRPSSSIATDQAARTVVPLPGPGDETRGRRPRIAAGGPHRDPVDLVLVNGRSRT